MYHTYDMDSLPISNIGRVFLDLWPLWYHQPPTAKSLPRRKVRLADVMAASNFRASSRTRRMPWPRACEKWREISEVEISAVDLTLQDNSPE